MLDARLLAFLLTVPIPGAAAKPDVASSELRGGQEPVVFPDLGLTLSLPTMESLSRKTKPTGTCEGEWTGTWNGSSMRVRLNVLPNADYDSFEPEDVVETWRDALRDPKKQGKEDQPYEFSFDCMRSLSGPVGCTPILALVQAKVQKRDDPTSEGLLLLAGGLLMDSGWSLRIDAWPAPDEEGTASLVKHLEGCVRYEGVMRDPKWTDADALAFWKTWAPESTFKKFEKPVRTKHFIFLTNSTSPTLYIKLIENRYASISKVLPDVELEGRKLLPVLLFRTDDDFEAFYRRKYKMKPAEDVDVSGLATGYYYATSCDRGSEYYHAIDLAKMILLNRQRAWGGGHWFCSGIREYVSSTPKDRLDGLRAVKKGKHTPLERLLDDEAWGNQSSKLEQKGTSDEADYWEQSAMWIEFLREGPWPKDSFPQFVRTVGNLPYGDGPGVANAIETIYGMDLGSLEKKWVQHFSKR